LKEMQETADGMEVPEEIPGFGPFTQDVTAAEITSAGSRGRVSMARENKVSGRKRIYR
jgi:hypothetical protein